MRDEESFEFDIAARPVGREARIAFRSTFEASCRVSICAPLDRSWVDTI